MRDQCQLPADRPPTRPRTYRPAVRPVVAAPTVAAPDGAVPLVFAALAALVYRYTGEPEVLLAFASDTFTVLRLGVDGTTSLADLAAAASAGIGRAEAGEGAGNGGAAGATDIPRYHAVVSLAAARGPGSDELRLADVVVVVDDGGDRFQLAMVTNADRFSAGGSDRLARHLGNMLRDDSRPVDELDLLDPEETERALFDWNDTTSCAIAAGNLSPVSVHELVEQVATRTPDAPAVVCGGIATSFGELNGGANRLARHLLALGAGDGSRVAVFLKRGTESLLTLLAVLKAGGAAVLLDPEHPAEQSASLLTRTAPVAVVTTGRLAEQLSAEGRAAGGRLVLIDGDDAVWHCLQSTDLGLKVTDDTISHLVASGPTAAAPVVVLCHGALRAAAEAVQDECGLTPDTRGSWLSSPASGLVALECLPVLAVGGAVQVPDPPGAATPDDLGAWLVANGITYVAVPPAAAERLWELDWPAATAVRTMVVAGARVPDWPPPGLPFVVLNVYSSAETVVAAACELGATAATLTGEQRAMRKPPIGRPIAHARAYVLDHRNRPMPPGVVGELHLGGPTLAAGYLDAPEATAHAFRTGPRDDRVHRTGHAARYWDDGTVEVLGRAGDPGHRTHGVAHQPGQGDAPFPLTARQRTLWSAAGREAGIAKVYDYYQWDRVGLDADRFLAAWQQLVDRHDALRIVIRADGTQVAGASAERPHKLRLVPLPGDRLHVALELNRLAVDADSAHRLLFAELDALYAGQGPAPAPAISFRDYSIAPLGQWAETDQPQPGPAVAAGRKPAARRLDVDPATWATLERGAASVGASASGAVVAALADALRAVASSHGTPVTLWRQVFFRPPVHPDIDAVVGYFANVAPVTADHGDVSFADRARELSRQPTDADANSRGEHGGEAGLSVLVTVLVDAGDDLAGTGALGPPDEMVSLSPHATLDVRVVRAGGGLRIYWTYPADSPAIAAVVDAYEARLGWLARNAENWWMTAGTTVRQKDSLGG